nr:MAG TPA: hypothetical protein [Bacteriophage sp.]
MLINLIRLSSSSRRIGTTDYSVAPQRFTGESLRS